MRLRLAFVFTIAVLVLAACGGGTASSPSGQTSAAPSVEVGASPSAASEEPTESPSEGASSAPSGSAGEAVVTLVDNPEYGQILADSQGKVLYGFTDDTAGEPTCTGGCADNWPAFLLEGGGSVTVGEGLDASQFTTVPALAGGEQIKVGDWPLYYFAADSAPGDTNGQGVGDKWFVVGADGELIKE